MPVFPAHGTRPDPPDALNQDVLAAEFAHGMEHLPRVAKVAHAILTEMTADDVGVGARVRLSEEGRARRLWAQQSDNEATIREATLVDNGRGVLCVRVTVDGERRARIRTMQLDYLDIVR